MTEDPLAGLMASMAPLANYAERLQAAQARQEEADRMAPSFEHVCIEAPLYQRMAIEGPQFLCTLRGGVIQFDAYCVHCGREAPFRSPTPSGELPSNSNWMFANGNFGHTLHCMRDYSHTYSFIFNYADGILTKFGQFPSIEDIVGSDLQQYRKVLSQEHLADLKKATGLASHGVGIGSFVYLRRIFERLIFEHHDELKDQGEAVEGFESLRMQDRIAALRQVLPPVLVANKEMYGILSAGIHEMSEESCKRFFPVVREGIIAILDQDLQRRKSAEAAEKLRVEIQKISGEVKAAPKG